MLTQYKKLTYVTIKINKNKKIYIYTLTLKSK